MIKHYDTCTARYPEKPEGERPQQTIDIDLEDGSGEYARTCCDCGAFEIVRKEMPRG